MKNRDRLALYGWPTVLVILMIASFGALLLLPQKKAVSPAHPLNTPAVKYTAMNSKQTAEPEEAAVMHALYASDLFASPRGIGLPAGSTSNEQAQQAFRPPSETPLFLSLAPPIKSTAAANLPIFEADESNPFPARRPAERSFSPSPGVAIELKGALKELALDRTFFKDIVLPTASKPWSMQAEVKLHKQGQVASVFAEQIDCEPSFANEIVRRLYQYRFASVTQACQGKIVISYPACSTANHPSPSTPPKETTPAPQ